MSPPDRPTDAEELPWLGDPSPRRRFRRGWLLVAVVFLVVVLGVTFGPLLQPLVTTGIRYQAGRRGYDATWASLQVRPPLRVRFRDLTVTRRATGDTLVRAESLAVTVNPWTLLLLRPQVSSLDVAHAAIRMRGSHAADPDTLVPEAASKRDHRDDPQRAARVRGMARSLVRLL
ncbi:MAG TPA: hypothetical protein VJY35_12260, partial [Candidatus Eisenbacteria bacterium]|nr:hypothetical protein [Candidatus Eisenbacteria bacterium]